VTKILFSKAYAFERDPILLAASINNIFGKIPKNIQYLLMFSHKKPDLGAAGFSDHTKLVSDAGSLFASPLLTDTFCI
jgi:hypothetical protein